MNLHQKLAFLALVSFALILNSCATAPTSDQLNAQLIQYDPALQGERFEVLSDFESNQSAAVAAAEPLPGAIDSSRAHTGSRSFSLPDNTQRLSVDLTPLLGTTQFPGDWTLAGGYFYCRHDVGVIISYQLKGRTVVQNNTILKADRWTSARVDLTVGFDKPAAGGTLVFEFPGGTSGVIWCDDLLLVNNDKTLFTDIGQAGQFNPWSIRQHGFNIVVERPGGVKKTLKTPEALLDGWRLVESNAIRARFVSDAKPTCLTIYADGRQYQDGDYLGDLVVSDPWSDLYSLCHMSPAQISLPADQGRIDRNTPGDARNTGYNQRLGAYELVAFGRHLEIRISPTAEAVAHPVFEITGVPDGKVFITLEGELIEQYVRLPDNRLLIEIPAKILRPSTLNIRVE